MIYVCCLLILMIFMLVVFMSMMFSHMTLSFSFALISFALFLAPMRLPLPIVVSLNFIGVYRDLIVRGDRPILVFKNGFVKRVPESYVSTTIVSMVVLVMVTGNGVTIATKAVSPRCRLFTWGYDVIDLFLFSNRPR